MACYGGHSDIVRYLVSELGCSTAYQNKHGNTPLLEACRYGPLTVVEILLTAPDCSTACKKCKNMLYYAYSHGWLDVSRRLVEQYHCDPDSRDKDGNTLLHKACHEGQMDSVRYLMVNLGAVQPVRTRMAILHCMWLVMGVIRTL